MSLFTKRAPLKERHSIKDLRRVVTVTEDGTEIITWLPAKVGDAGFGSAQDWSLDSMMKAGIDPASFNINTAGSINRLDSAGDLAAFTAEAEAIFAPEAPEAPTEE